MQMILIVIKTYNNNLDSSNGSASEANLHAFLQHHMSPLLPLNLMAHLSASKWRSLLLILTVIMATEPLNDPTPLTFDNFLSVTALAAMYNNPLPEPKPHPEQGGVCISSKYLDQFSEAEWDRKSVV